MNVAGVSFSRLVASAAVVVATGVATDVAPDTATGAATGTATGAATGVAPDTAPHVAPDTATGVAPDTAALAADRVFDIPAGWTASSGGHPMSGSPEGFAIAVYKPSASPDSGTLYESSAVLQVRGEKIVFTPMPELPVVSVLTYSSKGDLLLAGHVAIEDRAATNLLDRDGKILWTERSGRDVALSTTGQALTAWTPFQGAVDVLDLEGKRIRAFSIDSSLFGSLALGRGERVVLMLAEKLICLDAVTQSTAWQVEVPSEHGGIFAEYRAIDSKRIWVRMPGGMFVVNQDGIVEYAFAFDALWAADPSRAADEFAYYRAYPGPREGTLTWFDRSSVAYVLDLRSGRFARHEIDTTSPPGFKMGDYLSGHRILFAAPDRVLLRQLPLPE